MIGALADWFAVTALFRRPLGLPIPHTAIIPHRKEALGRSLGEFVGENFLSESVVRGRLRAVGLSSRLGAWLAEPAHAERVAREAGGMIRGALSVLDDGKVRQTLTDTLTRRLEAIPAGPPAGRLLARYVEADAHRPLADLLAQRAVDWLEDHPEAIELAVESEAPGLDAALHRRAAGPPRAPGAAARGQGRARRAEPRRPPRDRRVSRQARRRPGQGPGGDGQRRTLQERAAHASGDGGRRGRGLGGAAPDDPGGLHRRRRRPARPPRRGRALPRPAADRGRAVAGDARTAGSRVPRCTWCRPTAARSRP